MKRNFYVKKGKMWEKLLDMTQFKKKLIWGIFMVEPFNFIHAICIRSYIPLNTFIITIGPKIL